MGICFYLCCLIYRYQGTAHAFIWFVLLQTLENPMEFESKSSDGGSWQILPVYLHFCGLINFLESYFPNSWCDGAIFANEFVAHNILAFRTELVMNATYGFITNVDLGLDFFIFWLLAYYCSQGVRVYCSIW